MNNNASPCSDVSETAEAHGWQVSAEKFLLSSEGNITSIKVFQSTINTDAEGTKATDQVQCGDSSLRLARWRWTLSSAKKRRSAQKKQTKDQITELLSLTHFHLPQVIGCYFEEGPSIMNVLFAPAAEITLSMILRQPPSTLARLAFGRFINQWPVCMASALSYLHERNIMHGKVDSANFVCRGLDIVLIGFGYYAGRLSCGQSSINISGHVFSLDTHGLPATTVDVVSLGLVYTEMNTCVFGTGLDELKRLSEVYRKDDFKTRRRVLSGGHHSDLASGSIYDECLRLMFDVDNRPLMKMKDVHDVLLATLRNCRRHDAECNCVPEAINRVSEKRSGWQIAQEAFVWDSCGNTDLVLTDRGTLGKGVRGEVEEVKVPGYAIVMARKRFPMNRRKIVAQQELQRIKSEIENLKDLSHQHIVQAIGCYYEQSKASFYLLLAPSGDSDLGYFLEDTCRYTTEADSIALHASWLQRWFGCLASALAYLHHRNIQHQDLKPANIVHREGTVFLTDFGSSRQLQPGQDTSTDDPALATRMFGAPEVFPDNGQLQRHGSTADVYSLGLVFLEMLTVLIHENVEDFRRFVFTEKEVHTSYHQVPPRRFKEWFSRPGSTQGMRMYAYLHKAMLTRDRKQRSSAEKVVKNLRTDQSLELSNHCSCVWARWEKPSPREEFDVISDADSFVMVDDSE